MSPGIAADTLISIILIIASVARLVVSTSLHDVSKPTRNGFSAGAPADGDQLEDMGRDDGDSASGKGCLECDK